MRLINPRRRENGAESEQLDLSGDGGEDRFLLPDHRRSNRLGTILAYRYDAAAE